MLLTVLFERSDAARDDGIRFPIKLVSDLKRDKGQGYNIHLLKAMILHEEPRRITVKGCLGPRALTGGIHGISHSNKP